MARAVDQLNCSSGKSNVASGFMSAKRQQSRRAGMRRIRFGDDRIMRGDRGGKITAGNSSQVSDGAAAVMLMSREKADALGLKPRTRVFDHATVGLYTVRMMDGLIHATTELP